MIRKLIVAITCGAIVVVLLLAYQRSQRQALVIEHCTAPVPIARDLSTMPSALGIELPEIAFILTQGEHDSVARMRPDGSQIMPLTNGTDREVISVAWSPDKRQLAFVAMHDLWQELYLVDRTGIQRKRLNATEGTYAVAWSPNGRCLAVTRAGSDSAHCALWLYDLASGHEIRLVELGNTANQPAWSPDGQAITFVSTRDDPEGDVYSLQLTTQQVRRLTERPGFDGQPSWSPDGQHIAFMSNINGHTSIFVMDADGSHVSQRTPNAQIRFSNPDWSPDGQWLVFDGYTTTSQLYLLPADGDKIVQLTTPPDWHRAPAW